jgi:hypothetical protein
MPVFAILFRFWEGCGQKVNSHPVSQRMENMDSSLHNRHPDTRGRAQSIVH